MQAFLAERWPGRRQRRVWKEVSTLTVPVADGTVKAEELGLRELPKGWAGAPLAQLVSSARKIVEQSEATGGSGDPRLEAALKILEFKDGLKAGRKR